VYKDVEDGPARNGIGSCSSDQGRERQILVLGHGGVDERTDGGEVEVEGARSGNGEAEQVGVGMGEERGGFREAAEVACPPGQGAADCGVGAWRGVEEGRRGWGSVWGDGAVADEHGRRRRHPQLQVTTGWEWTDGATAGGMG